MPILGTDLLLVHRDGVDYNTPATNFEVKGEKGAKGAQGIKGAKGPEGEGATLMHFMGDVANQAALPGDAQVGDVYRTLDTGDYWAMSDSGWVDITEELAGTEGAPGEKGNRGDEGEKGAKGEEGVVGPKGAPGEDSAGDTSGLALANPSGGAYLSEGITLPLELPEMSDLFTQEDYNKWTHAAIISVEKGSANGNLDEYARLDGAKFTGACAVSYGWRGSYQPYDQFGYETKLGNELSWYHADDSHKLTMDDSGLTIEEYELDEGNDARPAYNRKVSIKEGRIYADHSIIVKPTDILSGHHYLEFCYTGYKSGLKIGRQGYDDQTFTVLEGAVTAKEFIGDGSKLTNLPVADVDLDEYARLDGATFTGRVFMKGEESRGCLFLSNNDAGEDATLEELQETSIITGRASGTNDITVNIAANGDSWFTNLRVINIDNQVTGVALNGKTGTVRATEFIGDGSKLTNLPTPVLEGALIFKGSVDTEASLPDSDNTVGDLWHTNDDDGLHAWGEDDAWHNIGSTEVDLDEYAKLDDDEQTITSYKYQTANPDSYLDPNGILAPTCDIYGNVQVTSVRASQKAGQGEFYVEDLGGIIFKNQNGTAYLNGLNNINFTGDNPNINGLNQIHFGGETGASDGIITNCNSISSAGDELKLQGDVRINGTITSTGGFIGDGSNLTNLPTTAASISEVLAAGNHAEATQSLHFKITPEDVENIELPFSLGLVPAESIDIPDFDALGGYGAHHRGVHSIYLQNEPFSFTDADGAPADLKWSVTRLEPIGLYTTGNYHNKSGDYSVTVHNNIQGIGFYAFDQNTDAYAHHTFDLESCSMEVINKDGSEGLYLHYSSDDPDHESNRFSINGPITANEFIGDGSKLTNLPTPTVDLDEYARLDGADFVGPITGTGGITLNGLGLTANGNGSTFNGQGIEVYGGGIHTGMITGENFTGTVPGQGIQIKKVNTIDFKEDAASTSAAQISYVGNIFFNDAFSGNTLLAGVHDINSDDTKTGRIQGFKDIYLAGGGSITTFSNIYGDGDGEITGFVTITADEFIGDGSKLTGLPAGLPDFRDLPALT